MAASGFTPIQLYRTTTAAAIPTAGNLADGELGINTTDEKLYFKNAAGTVKLLASNAAASGSFTTITSTGAASIQGLTVGLGASAISDSTAVGLSALSAQTVTASANNAFGFQALKVNTSGDNNVALGTSTLAANTTGGGNTACGNYALFENISGGFNTGIGRNALSAVKGSNNTGVGTSAGAGITTGSFNVVIGGYDGNTAPISNTGSNWIVLSDGAGNVRQAIDSAGNAQFLSGAVVVDAPAPTSIAAATILTNANIQNQIIVTTGTTYIIRMPVGTTLETLISWAGVDLGYDFTIINTASGTITLDAVETGVTGVGTLTVLTGVSANFRIRRTAANTFIVYRIS